MTEISYIFHDCFLIKMAGCAIIFDYWKDPLSPNSEYPRFLDALDPELPLYVYVSHSHKDHFSRDIFGWATRFPKIHYFVSRETYLKCRYIMSPTSIYAGPKIDSYRMTAMNPGHVTTVNNIRVQAFGSTDIGVSWLVECGGRRIFHAGDFNAWLWIDESTPEEVKQSRDAFSAILDTIVSALNGKQIDYAFFPVDSRIGSEFWTGARTFLRKIDVKVFFPMHFGIGDADEQALRIRDALNFGRYANPDRGEYIGLAAPGNSYADCSPHKNF